MRENFKVGDKVYFGRPNGEKTLGEIVKLNLKTAKVKTLENRGNRTQAGQVWGVGYSLLSHADGRALSKPVQSAFPSVILPKGDEEQLMFLIFSAYCDLSPEMLSCDGELSYAQITQRRKAIIVRLEALFQALGKRISEDEAFNWHDKNRSLSNAV